MRGIVIATGIVVLGGALAYAQSAAKAESKTPTKVTVQSAQVVHAAKSGKGDYKIIVDGKVVAKGTLKKGQSKSYRIVIDGQVVAQGRVGGDLPTRQVWVTTTQAQDVAGGVTAHVPFRGEEEQKVRVWSVRPDVVEPNMAPPGPYPMRGGLEERMARLEQRLARLEEALRARPGGPMLPPHGGMQPGLRFGEPPRTGLSVPNPTQGRRERIDVLTEAGPGPTPRVDFREDGSYRVLIGDRIVGDGKTEAAAPRNVAITVNNGRYRVEVNGKVFEGTIPSAQKK